MLICYASVLNFLIIIKVLHHSQLLCIKAITWFANNGGLVYPRESADLDNQVISSHVEVGTEQDVLTEAAGEDPGMLRDIGDPPAGSDWPWLDRQLSQDGH